MEVGVQTLVLNGSGIFATVPTLVSLFFGIAHFGVNYGGLQFDVSIDHLVCLLSPAVGSFSFGWVSGAVIIYV